MKTVYLIRHGESEANASAIFQPPESPLNESGRAQGDRVADRVAKLAFDVLISSPFPRAMATAEFIKEKTGRQPVYSDLFVERIKPSSINGKPFADQEANATWHAWDTSTYTDDLRVEDGENYSDLINRADAALAFLLKRPESTLVVVTHGYFLRTMVARVLLSDALTPVSFGNFQKSARMENTGISVLRHDTRFEAADAWHLWIYNDHAHLG